MATGPGASERPDKDPVAPRLSAPEPFFLGPPSLEENLHPSHLLVSYQPPGPLGSGTGDALTVGTGSCQSCCVSFPEHTLNLLLLPHNHCRSRSFVLFILEIEQLYVPRAREEHTHWAVTGDGQRLWDCDSRGPRFLVTLSMSKYCLAPAGVAGQPRTAQ